MREKWVLNLRIFDGGAAGGAGSAGAGSVTAGTGTGGSGAATGGAGASAERDRENGIQTLEDGTQVDHRLAERMEKQRKRHPEKYGKGTAANANGTGQAMGDPNGGGQSGNLSAAQGEQGQAQKQKTPEEEFEELIKGKYKDQYQARFQQGINDRFKNQADLQGQLDGLKPMLDALAKQRGIEAGNYEALSQNILDDDSLYEEEAEAAGMTVEAYKSFTKLKAEAEAAREKEQKDIKIRMIESHLASLAKQGEELKKVFPDFDLDREMQNPSFRRLTSPDVNTPVEAAYYAVHYRELAPQAMAAGIQRAQRQISQSLQANAARPMEGALQGNAAAAELHVSPRNMTREQRQALKERARRERVVL